MRVLNDFHAFEITWQSKSFKSYVMGQYCSTDNHVQPML